MSEPERMDWIETAVAITGMAGRFPGARDVDAYWRNLRDGVESVLRYDDRELEAAGVPASLIAHPDYVKAGAPLADVELFDAGFFGFSPLDASILDPQHRHFLECSWEALEAAGYAPGTFEGSVGVFAGSGHNAYLPYNLLTNPELVARVGFFLLRHTGNDKDFLTTRVSYLFDLRGPSVNVQTACSTSLVSVHMACQSLLNGECDMALAGGVTLELPHRHGYLYREGEILAPDGHCRAFDARSHGTVFGSGVGVVVLRRLADALRDRDPVLAVVRGSAVNNDGAGKVGYLAPSVDGQATSVAEAIAIAGVSPESIGYVETHGTGTAIGDPIEVAALTQAFRQGTQAKGFCAIGSVKPNIGHLDTAAGVASLIKTTLALRHRQLPPSLHFESPNPEIDFSSSPFVVNASLRDWPAGAEPRRAGVSSLGVGGTNAHVILEEAPAAQEPASASRGQQLLLLSARSEASLDAATDRFARHLREHPEQDLADVAHTLRIGRRAFDQRRILVCSGREDAVRALESGDPLRLLSGKPARERRRVAFLFPGGGAQYPNMGRDLYETEPVYRSAVDECLALLAPGLRAELTPVLFPAPDRIAEAAERFERPSLQLPALFIVEWAMAKLWMAWGIEPTALVGHSMGENTAACLSGVLRLADALALVSLRGRLFEQVPAGAMLAIPLSADEVTPLLPAELSLASINAPELCAASGPIAAIDALAARLAEREVETRRVKIQIAAHSAMLDPILPEWRAFLAGLELSAPRIPFVSNLTGTWIRPEEATDPEYWVRHLRGSVRFADGIRTLCEDPDRLLLEVGPGRTLATLARLHPARTREQPALHSLRHPEEEGSDLAFVLGVLGQLWLNGAAPDWQAFSGQETRRRVTLPTYAWDHQRHWIAPGKQLYQEGAAAAEAERRADIGDWFYAPDWRLAPLPAPESPAPAVSRRTLVFAGEAPLSDRIVAALKARGDEVVCVRAGAAYAAPAPGEYVVRPGAPEDFAALLGALAAAGRPPSEALHLWNLGGAAASLGDHARVRGSAFTSLLGFAQAVGSEDWTHGLRLLVVSSGMQEVAGEGVPAPLRALLLGPCRVIPREYPNLRCRSVDVALPEPGSRAEARLAQQLLAELGVEGADLAVAYRGRERLVQRFEPCRLEAPKPNALRLRPRGVYLVTGGLGGLGLTLARHLATRVQARLVLLGRTSLPPREAWQGWLETHPEHDRTSRRLREIAAIEAAGGEVMIASVDVQDSAQLRGVVEAARARFGALHGVIHAAGVLDDGLIQFKTPASADRVLAPKVAGTLALDAALDGVPLDFLLLYSSLSALAGLPGQIDYTAANAFLDAFAQHRNARETSPTFSVGWGAWQEVGIAAELLRAAQGEAQPDRAQTGHPFLESCLRDDPERQIFATRFDTEAHWLVGEHRVLDGTALIPGTGYLELARAALATRPEPRAIEIRDTFLMLPFVVQDGSPRELRLELDRATGDFAITSQDAGAGVEHVRGTIAWADEGAPDKISLEDLRARCRARTETHEGLIPQAHLRFGPRWACVRRIDFGEAEALALLELPEAFAGDLDLHALHPALLDMATGCAHALIPDHDGARDFYVPMSYARLLMRAPLPRRFYSHLRLRSDARGDRDFAIFDATLYDESGVALVELEEFMLKRLAGGISLAAPAAAAPASQGEALPNPLLAQLGDAIRPAEGMEALDRLLAAPARSQIMVSPLPLAPWIAKLTAVQGPGAAAAPRAELSPELAAELAAVEAVVHEHPAVAEAAVTAHFDRPGEKRLLAHVVWRADHPATVSELRRFLRERLSADRLPQNFVELEALPRGEGGALERSALRDPFGRGDDYVAPRSEAEKAIARIWQEILGIERVGLHDNFFDIGGHSLLAMRAIVRTEKKLGARLNNAIMVLQTLEQVAAECSRRVAGRGAGQG